MIERSIYRAFLIWIHLIVRAQPRRLKRGICRSRAEQVGQDRPVTGDRVCWIYQLPRTLR